MPRVCKSFFAIVLSFAITVSAAMAADVALVIGNRNYLQASWMYGAENVMNSASGLRNSGYAVVSGRDLSVPQTRQALDGFLARFANAERAAIVLSGHFVHSATDTWFVSVDASRPDLGSISYDGLSLNTLMDIAAAKPGGAAIFLGTVPRQIDLGFGLKPGIGDLAVPQGVFVAIGSPADIDLTIRRDFLAGGAGFATALANAPASVSGSGFVSDMGSLLALNGARRNEGEISEEAYWRAVRDIDTADAMQAYLNAYPAGRHATEARNWLDSNRPKTPEEMARDAEAALGLGRQSRQSIQENLSLLGYDTRGIDGIFGRGTRAAITAWQGDNNFVPVGYLSRAQINRLDRQATDRARQLAEEAQRNQRELELADRGFWQSSGAAAGDEDGLRRYLRRYPDGLFADVAFFRLDAIEKAKRDQLRRVERDAWDRAVQGNSVESYQTYLDRFPSGAFSAEARARKSDLKREAARRAELEAAQQQEDGLQLNAVARVLVENQLLALGFKAGVPDGTFDKKTRRAIRRFQRTRGLEVSGYLNRETIVRLLAESG